LKAVNILTVRGKGTRHKTRFSH